MKKYYELMLITRRRRSEEDISAGVKCLYTQDEFKNMGEMDELARNVEIDSESMTVSSAVGIIRWLLKNDESIKGKYIFKKKR